jgi:nucleoside phosphorylase
MKPIVVIAALMSEAAPLIDKWGLKPVRNAALLERFQTFSRDGRYVAVSGIGKLKSATATSVLTTALNQEDEPLLINIGLAGARPAHAQRGDLFVVNKVRDVSTNTRFYPDILVRHPVRESALDTHDHPVTTPPAEPILVDMEASGFMQAATSIVSPSAVLVLKVVSDGCDGQRLTPADATSLIEARLDVIDTVIASSHAELKSAPTLSTNELANLEQLITMAHFSQSQRLELSRSLVAFKARGGTVSDILASCTEQEVSAKHARRALFDELMNRLREGVLP